MCQRERMLCGCCIKVHLCSRAVQLLLSTPDFPNAFLNKGSSQEYPEPGGFPGVLLDLAGSSSCTLWAWSDVIRLINGRGMELRLAVGKGGDLPSQPEAQTLDLSTCYTTQTKQRFDSFSKLHPGSLHPVR